MDLPEGIGPHEGREFDLMKQGDKHVALFFELEPEGLKDILCEGFKLLKFRQFVKSGAEYFTYIVYRDTYENDARRLKELVQSTSTEIDPIREHEIGKILGYSREQVEVFIQHISR